MINMCKQLRIRQKQYNKYFYCCELKTITCMDKCKKCLKFEPHANNPINKRSDKINKLERQRDKNLIKKGNCGYCGKLCGKLDAHEVFGGPNRKRSIKNGFVILLCRECHSNEKILLELKKKFQKKYELTHTREEFIKLIGKNYLMEE